MMQGYLIADQPPFDLNVAFNADLEVLPTIRPLGVRLK
jgi:hypothetical protein